jgi:hypothetical protein
MPSVAAITVAVVHAMPFWGEAAVVGPTRPGEPVVEVGADALAELAARERLAAVGERVVAVARGEVHELVGELVVVLQRMHERRGVDPEPA